GQGLGVHLELVSLVHGTPSFSEARSGRGWRDFSGTFAGDSTARSRPSGQTLTDSLDQPMACMVWASDVPGTHFRPPKPINKLPLGFGELLPRSPREVSLLA